MCLLRVKQKLPWVLCVPCSKEKRRNGVRAFRVQKKEYSWLKNIRVHLREMLKIRTIFTNMLTGRGSKSTKGVRARKNASIACATLSR